jgi:hypothetical protein
MLAAPCSADDVVTGAANLAVKMAANTKPVSASRPALGTKFTRLDLKHRPGASLQIDLG